MASRIGRLPCHRCRPPELHIRADRPPHGRWLYSTMVSSQSPSVDAWLWLCHAWRVLGGQMSLFICDVDCDRGCCNCLVTNYPNDISMPFASSIGFNTDDLSETSQMKRSRASIYYPEFTAPPGLPQAGTMVRRRFIGVICITVRAPSELVGQSGRRSKD